MRRTIQREIEDKLSEKILFGEVEPGQIVIVDVDNWDGEGPDDQAVFTFRGEPQIEVSPPERSAASPA